jgi:hypothetical protein
MLCNIQPGPSKHSHHEAFHLNNWSDGTAGTVSNCKFMLCHLQNYHPIEVKTGHSRLWSVLKIG